MKIVLDHPDNTVVGIKLSGGPDSSIIYYAFCKKYQNNDSVNIVAFSLSADQKPYYVMYAERIVEKVAELTGKRPLDHLKISGVPWSDFVVGQERLRKEGKTKYPLLSGTYSGLTNNPNIDKMKQYFIDNAKRFGLDLDRILLHISRRDLDRDTYNNTNEGYAPFGASDKLAVAQAYKDYDMIDLLYPFTDSCEDFNRKLDANNDPIHCNDCCFHCLERWYAFGKIK